MATARNPVPQDPAPVLRCRLKFVVEHDPWARVFLRNMADLFVTSPPPPYLTARPAKYWADAWVDRPVAWSAIARSALAHVLVIIAIYGLDRMLVSQPRLVTSTKSTTIANFQLSEYLPPVSSGKVLKKPATVRRQAQKADPSYSPQEIVSIAIDHNSTQQTIVQPDLNLLNRDLPLPNMAIWTPIPSSAPIAPRRTISQFVPPGAPQVVPPVADTAKRNLSTLQSAIRPDVVAPATPVTSHRAPIVPVGTVAVLPPAQDPTNRPLGNLDLPGEPQPVAPPAQSSVSASGPDKSAQIAQPDSRESSSVGQGQAIVPATPIASGTGKAQAQEMGQLLVLNAHPVAPTGPLNVPEGNRRGEFAAGPDGRAGASGKPEIKAGGPESTGAGGSSTGGSPAGSGGPAGVYVGAPPGKVTGNVVVAAPAAPAVKARPAGPNMADLPGRNSGRIEENVFSGRKYYSMLLAMPNLNSAGASWTMRFAELNPRSDHTVTDELSGPMAISKADPAYPPDLIRDRIEGVVVLYAVIRSDGTVSDVRILEGVESQLDENARAALERWRFRPGTRGGVPVDVEAVIHIPFRVPRRAF